MWVENGRTGDALRLPERPKGLNSLEFVARDWHAACIDQMPIVDLGGGTTAPWNPGVAAPPQPIRHTEGFAMARFVFTLWLSVVS